MLQWTGANGIFADGFLRLGTFETTNKTFSSSYSSMLSVESENFRGDDVWLWRADHDIEGLVYDHKNDCQVGLEVLADNVKFFGLAVEHCGQAQVDWRGNDGAVVFFQSEYPYDADSDFDEPAYKVADSVTSHSAIGAGAYAYFRDNVVNVSTAIQGPRATDFIAPFAVYLNGLGALNHVLNNHGPRVGPNTPLENVQHLCDTTKWTTSPEVEDKKKKKHSHKNGLGEDDDDQGRVNLKDLAISLSAVAGAGLLVAFLLMRRHAMMIANEDIVYDARGRRVDGYRAPPEDDEDGEMELREVLLDTPRPSLRPPPPKPFVQFTEFDYEMHY